jgi:hypothetical protein
MKTDRRNGIPLTKYGQSIGSFTYLRTKRRERNSLYHHVLSTFEENRGESRCVFCAPFRGDAPKHGAPGLILPIGLEMSAYTHAYIHRTEKRLAGHRGTGIDQDGPNGRATRKPQMHTQNKGSIRSPKVQIMESVKFRNTRLGYTSGTPGHSILMGTPFPTHRTLQR